MKPIHGKKKDNNVLIIKHILGKNELNIIQEIQPACLWLSLVFSMKRAVIIMHPFNTDANQHTYITDKLRKWLSKLDIIDDLGKVLTRFTDGTEKLRDILTSFGKYRAYFHKENRCKNKSSPAHETFPFNCNKKFNIIVI